MTYRILGFIQADVRTPDGTEKIIKETLAKLGGLDILINNVGGSSSSTAGALALAFLSSDRASYITGSEHIIDGGIIRTTNYFKGV